MYIMLVWPARPNFPFGGRKLGLAGQTSTVHVRNCPLTNQIDVPHTRCMRCMESGGVCERVQLIGTGF